MSNTVFVEFEGSDQIDHVEGLLFTTKTGQKRMFFCHLVRENLYLKFLNPTEDFTVFQQLELVNGLLNEDSNFREKLSVWADYPEEKWENILIGVEVDPHINCVVMKDSDLEDLMREYYRYTKKYIVCDGDSEEEILERARKIEYVHKVVRDRFKEEVYDPLLKKSTARRLFFDEEEYELFVNELKPKANELFAEYLSDFTLDESESDEKHIYLEIVKAIYFDDTEEIDRLVNSLKQ